MNRGDTSFLMLNYTLNGDPIPVDVAEIELSLDSKSPVSKIRKLLTEGDIEYGTLTYEDDEGHTQSFTGYYCHLSQEDTFALSQGTNKVQLRVLMNDEVGSSAVANFELGEVLSDKVLNGNS